MKHNVSFYFQMPSSSGSFDLHILTRDVSHSIFTLFFKNTYHFSIMSRFSVRTYALYTKITGTLRYREKMAKPRLLVESEMKREKVNSRLRTGHDS